MHKGNDDIIIIIVIIISSSITIIHILYFRDSYLVLKRVWVSVKKRIIFTVLSKTP